MKKKEDRTTELPSFVESPADPPRVTMLMGSGGMPYRHKLPPEVVALLKGIQDTIISELKIKPSQPVVISRAVELYDSFLAVKKASKDGFSREALALMVCAGRA